MQLLKPPWVAAEGNPIFSVDIHPDGSRFATGGQGSDQAVGRICLWNLAPILSAREASRPEAEVPKLLAQMDRHLGCVNCLRWSPSGRFLASGADDKLVMVWKKSPGSGGGGAIFGGGGKVNVESWRCAHTLSAHQGDVLDLAWSEGDRLLATASVDNTVIVWNGEKLPEMVTTLRAHNGLVKGVAFDPVGRFLATHSDDRTLRVWRLSDWKEERCAWEPFAECGSTTHVLRPGWSPEGSMLVSAHAMNEGGPTAQIFERDSWSTKKDFVGHKKAVTCVRFNGNILEPVPASKSGEKEKKDKASAPYVMVALGSRDRSFSVWSTNLRRPLFVVSDAFEQSVLDLSWSRDGRVLIACSMDGSVAAVVLKEEELGRPISEEKKRDLLSKMYGKNIGLPAIKSSKKEVNGTSAPMVVENPELLLRPNGDAPSPSRKPERLKEKPKPRGPTDKQIEARTSDGKRRITPIFIPPDESSQGFGSGEFQSQSTKETSTIEIEKKEGIVNPNVSPSGKGKGKGKGESSSSSSSNSAAVPSSSNKNAEGSSSPSASAKSKDPKPKEDKKGSDDDDDAGAAFIQVRRKPRKRIIASDDEDEAPPAVTATAASSSSSDKKNEATPEKVAKKPEEKKPDDTPAKFKELASSRPNLLVAKRKADGGGEDDSPKPKKRGRPPLNRSREEEMTSVTPSAQLAARANGAQQQQPEREVSGTIVVRSSAAALSSSAVLPPLLIERPRSVAFSPKSAQGARASVQVLNNYTRVGEATYVHLVKFFRPTAEEDREERMKLPVQVLLPSPVNSVTLACSSELVVLTCLDSSLHLFSPRGDRFFPPLMTPSPVANVAVAGDLLAAVTTSAKFFLWQLCEKDSYRPTILVRNECVLSLLERGGDEDDTAEAEEEEDGGDKKAPVTVSRLSINESSRSVVVVTSVGKSFVFDEKVGAWLRLADVNSAVASISSTPASALELVKKKKKGEGAEGNDNLPLASITLGTKSTLTSADLAGRGAEEQDLSHLRLLADAAQCRDQLAAARYLNSPAEYLHWFVCLASRLSSSSCGGGAEARARVRELLDPLLEKQEEKIMGSICKKELLRQSLVPVGRGGVEFQRLCAEYTERLLAAEASNGGGSCFADLDDLLHGGGDGGMAENLEGKKDTAALSIEETEEKMEEAD